MKWDEINRLQCSIARSSAVLGDRWTLLILSDVFLGVRRFDDFHQRLGLSRTTLTNRLKLLEDHQVLSRVQYQSSPDRYEYKLTDKGRDLYPVISTVLNWGDKYYSDTAGPPILRRHTLCGHDILPVLSCPECHQEIDARNIAARTRPDIKNVPAVERGPFMKKVANT